MDFTLSKPVRWTGVATDRKQFSTCSKSVWLTAGKLIFLWALSSEHFLVACNVPRERSALLLKKIQRGNAAGNSMIFISPSKLLITSWYYLKTEKIENVRLEKRENKKKAPIFSPRAPRQNTYPARIVAAPNRYQNKHNNRCCRNLLTCVKNYILRVVLWFDLQICMYRTSAEKRIISCSAELQLSIGKLLPSSVRCGSSTSSPRTSYGTTLYKKKASLKLLRKLKSERKIAKKKPKTARKDICTDLCVCLDVLFALFSASIF